MRNLFLILSLLSPAADSPLATMSQPEFLARVRAVNRRAYSDLESFICTEQIQRFRGSLDSEKIFSIDTVTASLSYLHGIEQYVNIRQNGRPRPSMASLTGAWSQGEFGTLLQQTGALLATQTARYERRDELAGTGVEVFSFAVDRDNSPWELHVDGQTYRVPFRSEVWVSPLTGQILKLSRESTSLRSDMLLSSLRWEVTLGLTELGGTDWLLPKRAVYEVRYQESGRREWNVIDFSGYQRYSVDVAIRFGGVQ